MKNQHRHQVCWLDLGYRVKLCSYFVSQAHNFFIRSATSLGTDVYPVLLPRNPLPQEQGIPSTPYGSCTASVGQGFPCIHRNTAGLPTSGIWSTEVETLPLSCTRVLVRQRFGGIDGHVCSFNSQLVLYFRVRQGWSNGGGLDKVYDVHQACTLPPPPAQYVLDLLLPWNVPGIHMYR